MTRTATSSIASTSPERARLAGALLVLGMIVFWAGAFAPVPVDYVAPVDEQFASVANDPTMWLVANLLFVAGAGLTAAGVYVLARLFGDTLARRLAAAAVVLSLLGAAVFAVTAYYRVTLPGADLAGGVPPLFEAAMGGWLYGSYLTLTLVSFACLGGALFVSSTMRRLGAFAVLLSVVELLLFALLGDLPPLLFYLVTAPIGVWLVRQAGRQGQPEDRPEGGTAGAP